MNLTPESGIILHQPLIRRIFVNFGKKGQKMNGISVSRSRKTQNAPTWQVEKQAWERAFSAHFYRSDSNSTTKRELGTVELKTFSKVYRQQVQLSR